MANPQEELDLLRQQVASLTARVHRLEQRTGVEPESFQGALQQSPMPPGTRPADSSAAPRSSAISGSEVGTTGAAPPPPRPPRPAPAGPIFAQPQRSTEDLEGTIGKLWLNRIGIVAILLGVSYFLKYAFDNGWIGEGGRVAIGLIAGISVILWSERFRSRGSVAFSYSLKAVGIGILYLSLWAASQRYHLIPSSAAFVAMIVVTAST